MMPSRKMMVRAATRRAIKEIFARLDYARLGPIYCDEGGDEFWKAKRGLCQRLGMKLANALLPRLTIGGASLYVGAGVAEIPLMAMECFDLSGAWWLVICEEGSVDPESCLCGTSDTVSASRRRFSQRKDRSSVAGQCLERSGAVSGTLIPVLRSSQPSHLQRA